MYEILTIQSTGPIGGRSGRVSLREDSMARVKLRSVSVKKDLSEKQGGSGGSTRGLRCECGIRDVKFGMKLRRLTGIPQSAFRILTLSSVG